MSNFEKTTTDDYGQITEKELKRNEKKVGLLETESFQPRLSKPIIDQIGIALANHYGFTKEELDFIINYDIKYRMGKEIDEAD